MIFLKEIQQEQLQQEEQEQEQEISYHFLPSFSILSSSFSSSSSSSSSFYFILLFYLFSFYFLSFYFQFISSFISSFSSSSSSSLSSSSSSSSSSSFTSKFYCFQSDFNLKVSSCLQKSLGIYSPPWWYNNHIVSIIQFGRKLNLNYINEEFILNDKSNFIVKWYLNIPPPLSTSTSTTSTSSTTTKNTKNSENKKDLKICVFIPGLGSLSTDNYVTSFVNYFAENGYYCAVITHRGYESPLNTHKVWYPAITDDTVHFLEHISSKYPHASIFLAGYSAGSNIIQNTLLRLDSSNSKIKISGVFCGCINWCYSTTLKRLEKSGSISGFFYSLLLTFQIKKILSNSFHHIEAHHGKDAVQSLSESKLISDIDRATRKIYGFQSEAEMYSSYSGLKNYFHHTVKSSSLYINNSNHNNNNNNNNNNDNNNNNIMTSNSKCPIFLLQPLDDPLHQGGVRENIPINMFETHHDIIYMETDYGGHIGYIEGGLFEAFTSKTCYLYPAKVALIFFNLICEENKRK